MSETSIVTRGHGAYGRSLQNSRNHLCCTSKLLTVSVGLSSLSCCFYWSCTNTSGCWQERREILATLLDFTWVFHSFHILQDLTQKFDTLPAIRVPASVLSVGILRNTSQKMSHIQHMGYSKCACFEKKNKTKGHKCLTIKSEAGVCFTCYMITAVSTHLFWEPWPITCAAWFCKKVPITKTALDMHVWTIPWLYLQYSRSQMY